jgi:hypothetical protein
MRTKLEAAEVAGLAGIGPSNNTQANNVGSKKEQP